MTIGALCNCQTITMVKYRCLKSMAYNDLLLYCYIFFEYRNQLGEYQTIPTPKHMFCKIFDNDDTVAASNQ